MVKKLFKHEFLAWLRVLPVIYAITLGMAAMHRILQFFENDSDYYAMLNGSALSIYIIALTACLVTPLIFAVVRFYRHLFTGEGYLTMTLPVTAGNHLWVKCLTAVAFFAISALVGLLSGMIITAGEVFAEICKAAAYLLKQIPGDAAAHLAGYIAELLVLTLVALFSSCFFYYTCICLGQRFRRHRVLAAVGVYFGFHVASQFLATFLGVFLMAMELTLQLEKLEKFFDAHPEASVHIFLGGQILLSTLVAGVYFLICHHTIRKKLNLE